MKKLRDKNYQNLEKSISVADSQNLFDFFIILATLFSVIISLFITYGKVDSSNIAIRVFNYLITPLSCIISIILLCVRKKDTGILALLKPKKQHPDFIIATILITIGMLFGLSELNYFFVDFLEFLGLKSSQITLPEKTPTNVVLTLIFLAVFPAFFEEIIFRGLITKGFKGTGDAVAILFSGFLFSIYHMSPSQTIYQFIVGCLYALIVVKGGSYILTICSHLFNNAFIILNEYYLKFAPVGFSKIALTIVGLLCLACGLIILLKKPKTEKTQSLKVFFKEIPIGIILCLFTWFAGLFV